MMLNLVPMSRASLFIREEKREREGDFEGKRERSSLVYRIYTVRPTFIETPPVIGEHRRGVARPFSLLSQTRGEGGIITGTVR